jgi:hypothetical protein
MYERRTTAPLVGRVARLRAGWPRGPRRWLLAAAVGLLAVVLVVTVVRLAGSGAGGGARTAAIGGAATLFGSDEAPASTERHEAGRSVELGVRFTASVDGALAGLRYFRTNGDQDAHPATAWSAAGAVLASTTFPATAYIGWQDVKLAAPVQLTAGQVYVVSYHTASGYVADPGYFNKPSAADGPVSTPVDGRESSGVFTYADSPTLPTSSFVGTNYWIDVLFQPGFSGVSQHSTAAPTTGAEPDSDGVGPTPGSTVAPASTGPGRAAPDQVGFRGDRGSLTVIDGASSAPPGTTWEGGTLVIRSGSVTLDRVWVKGGIDFHGTGTLTVSNSVVQANGASWSVVLGRDFGGELRIRDSTIVWPSDVPPPGDIWGNAAIQGDARMILERNDISGTPDGVQQSSGKSTFDQNYIHDLRTGAGRHNDGIQLYGGPGVVVRGNYIVLDLHSGSVNAAVFLSDDGSGFDKPVIDNNYLVGGGYVLRLEDGCKGAVVTGNDFGPLTGYGNVNVTAGASVARWQDNVNSEGVVLARP